MIRFLYLTDTHIRGTSPANRLDHFPDTLKRKLNEAVDLANQFKVDAVLHGGDVFDVPSPSPSVVGEFLSIFTRLNCPLYGIIGNHDVFAHNPQTLDRTMLGLANRLGIIRIIHPGERIYVEKEGTRVQLTGQHFHVDLDRRDPTLDYCITKENADIAIHMVHGMLMDRRFIEGVAHTIIDQIVGTEADMTLCGHNHLGFRDTERDGKIFLNPGGFVRLSNHPAEMARRPQMVLIEIENAKLKYRKIPLQSAPKGDEVLDRSKGEEAIYREQKLNAIVDEIKQAGQFQYANIHDIIEQLANREGITAPVRDLVMDKIAQAQERLEASES
ncbi:metallophosphoesterase family protein [Ammoniphilus sp. YIM 78166]|uniref:metallophosphoesterase family protein n=1 Tax=Ammoniphilus sp. YIM 78166 TaxID=1644106 RepID=UPI00196AC956|nr:metallophosphoesterase family protein [Ammoniphilus sp. YIM 78166]